MAASLVNGLTHLYLNKMASISQTFSNAFFFMKMSEFRLQISLKFFSGGPFDNAIALVEVMACHRTGDKPLPEPMLTKVNDAYMCH